MIPLKVFLSRLSDLLRRRERDQRLDEEIGGHLDLLTAEFLEKGLSPRRPGRQRAALSAASIR